MEKLLQFQHSNNIQQNNLTKKWYFTMDDNIFCLIYNECSIILQNKTIFNNNFYLKKLDDKMHIPIDNIDTWLIKYIIYIENSSNNYKKCYELIEYINIYISNYTFKTYYNIGWYIPTLLRLSIDFYKNSNEPYILLNHKNKDIILSEDKLKSFLKKNEKIIVKTQKKIKEEYLLKIKKEKIESNYLPPLNSDEKMCLKSNFYIKKDFKERYEIQACKPFPDENNYD